MIVLWVAALGFGAIGGSSGEETAFDVRPAEVRLVGPGASAQVVATGPSANGRRLDLSRSARYEVLDPRIAEVSESGLIRPVGEGTTEIVVKADGRESRLRVEVADLATGRPVGFASEIEPILTKYGCNAGACHGKASGQGGFRLSLLGFDAEADYDAIARASRGRRVFPADPPRSLILAKPTAALTHGGGRRFDPDSPEADVLSRWIAGGMPREVEGEPSLEALVVEPAERLLLPGNRQQLRVSARYSDGTEADVTRLARYGSNAEDLATVDETGLVAAGEGVGPAAVMVRYAGLVGVARVIVPRVGETIAWDGPEPLDDLDRLVEENLRALNLPPSPPCTDAEFARRSSLDLCGILPEPAAVVALEQDDDPEKRAKWVDRLLERPEYADYFALKWSAILKNRQGFFGEGARAATTSFHAWIRQAIAENMPYDEFAASLLAARGDPSYEPAASWYRPQAFNVSEPSAEGLAEDAAQLFLGQRIACAKCHHHPFERWGQEDYYGFASFFARVGLKPGSDPFAPRVFNQAEGLATHPGSGESYPPKALGGPAFPDLGPRDDPRDRLVEWLRRPENPFFARAVVNRYWKHFFGRGLVEPEDDLRASNPATNPELLDMLAADFVASGYDLKALARRLATSRAYGRSSLPTPENAEDRRNDARFYARRLPAEVLFDAINHVTGTTPDLPGLPPGFRAVQLPDESGGTDFLKVFGRPERTSVCECERVSEANLAQRLHLLNSDEVETKVVDGRAAKLADPEADPRPDPEKVEELYRLAFARRPTAEERDACLRHLSRARERGNLKAGYEDLIWTLINANEFLFNR